MEHVKRLVVAIVAVVILGAGLSLLGEVRAASSVEGGKQALPSRKDVVGSWLVTYDVPAFGPPFPLLLSLGDEGVVIETTRPGRSRLARSR